MAQRTHLEPSTSVSPQPDARSSPSLLASGPAGLDLASGPESSSGEGGDGGDEVECSEDSSEGTLDLGLRSRERRLASNLARIDGWVHGAYRMERARDARRRRTGLRRWQRWRINDDDDGEEEGEGEGGEGDRIKTNTVRNAVELPEPCNKRTRKHSQEALASSGDPSPSSSSRPPFLMPPPSSLAVVASMAPSSPRAGFQQSAFVPVLAMEDAERQQTTGSSLELRGRTMMRATHHERRQTTSLGERSRKGSKFRWRGRYDEAELLVPTEGGSVSLPFGNK